MRTLDYDVRLAKRIEAGLLAQELLESGVEPERASQAELSALVEEGRLAKEEMFRAHLGLVVVIAAESARNQRGPYPDLYQEGCLGLHQAVLHYDFQKGPFGPYAGMWIRAAVRRLKQRSWESLEGVEVEDRRAEGSYDRTITHAGLARALDRIHPRERQILQLRSGWAGSPLSRVDVAAQLGLSLAQVRYLEQQALESVREHLPEAMAA